MHIYIYIYLPSFKLKGLEGLGFEFSDLGGVRVRGFGFRASWDSTLGPKGHSKVLGTLCKNVYSSPKSPIPLK